MKKPLLYLFLILAFFAVVYSGISAQTPEGDTRARSAESLSAEKGDDATADSFTEGVTDAVEREGTTLDVGNEKGLVEKKKAEAKAREARRAAEKKAEERRAAEQKRRDLDGTKEKQAEGGDRDTAKIGDSLLMIDHESLKYHRIPDITIKAEETGMDIVKIPDDSVPGNDAAKPKGGIFGTHTDTIAKWGLLIFVFIIFIIYKTRSKGSRRKVVQTITKR